MESEIRFIKVLETDSLTDIALIKSVLDAEGVHYFFQGEHMKVIELIHSTTLMVAEEDLGKAIELITPLGLKYVQILRGARG
ncbi:MAG: DUF2007 domain-containing protein [Ignavibacteria bacterium]|nr:DUF2007 domain-containing protein [Ignavibacteria bacterium]